MRVFVDTSALYALLDSSDRFHADAAQIFQQLSQQMVELITTNYVVVETIALLQSRLGVQAVEDFIMNVKPLLTIVWVDAQTHNSAELALLSQRRRRVSIVDHVSFVVMRYLSMSTAFANDSHFADAGFTLLQP